MPFFHFVYYFSFFHIVKWVNVMRIVIYDSGFGLIPFYQTLLQHKIYHTYFLEMEEEMFPLGEKSEKELIKYADKKIEEWKEKRVDHVFIVCNTFSLILKKMNLTSLPFQLHLIIEETLALLKNKDATIIGTKRTVTYLKKEGPTVINASKLVRFIEERNVEEIIKWIKKQKIKTPYLLLGCTHFSHIAFLFSIYFPHLILLDSYLSFLSYVPKGNHLKVYMNRKAKKAIKSFQN